MLAKLRHSLSYANVMATIAVLLAVGVGSVYAASKINGKTIMKGSIPGNRLKPGSVTGVQVNTSTLGTVPNATHAGGADSATSANHATNSDQLGGSPASAFQSRVGGTCSSGNAISSIAQNGTVACQSTNVAQMMGGSIGTVSLSGSLLAPVGLSTPTSTSSDISMPASEVPSTAGNLYIQISAAPNMGDFVGWQFNLIVNNTLTSLGCSITGSSTSCPDTTDTASIPAEANVWLSVSHVGGGAPPAPRVSFGWTDIS